MATIDAQYDQPCPLSLPLQVPGGMDEAIELYIKWSDTVHDKHQSLAGCYLNALVLYTTIFGRSPMGAAPPNASWGPRWGMPDAPLTDANLLTLQMAALGTVRQCGVACGQAADFVV